MREVCEFRVVEEFAPKLFAEKEGKRLGDTVRKVELATDDPRFDRIGELQRETIAATGRSFFHGWNIRYFYSKAELAAARCFQLSVKAVFEPPGEKCGTVYDESEGCPLCRAGAEQVGPLFLNLNKIPKGKDFARTIADEIIVSRRAVDLFRQQGINGVDFGPVRHNSASRYGSEDWFQLLVQSAKAEIVPPTRVGIDPFDDDLKGECRCPRGDLIGLNLLSEVSIKSETRGQADVGCTRQFIGTRRGLLRPRRLILISPKVWRLLESERLKGCEIEVAHLV